VVVRADARCAWVQAHARAGRTSVDVDAHLLGCDACREVTGQYRWLAAELRALAEVEASGSPALVAAIGRRIDDHVRRLRRVRAVATVAGGLVVAGAGVATTVARRDRLASGALGMAGVRR
jgi:predicted anti-sigma-YlaC factor YlaD